MWKFVCDIQVFLLSISLTKFASYLVSLASHSSGNAVVVILISLHLFRQFAFKFLYNYAVK